MVKQKEGILSIFQPGGLLLREVTILREGGPSDGWRAVVIALAESTLVHYRLSFITIRHHVKSRIIIIVHVRDFLYLRALLRTS